MTARRKKKHALVTIQISPFPSLVGNLFPSFADLFEEKIRGKMMPQTNMQEIKGRK